MESGYFFIGDVLGFKNIVTNSAHTELDGSVESWVSLVEGAAAFAQLSEKPQLISDTVFAAAPSGVDGLRQLIQFARYLLENGFKNSFLVRGAITFGPYHWGRLTYGKAVISAHEIEMSQDWIGVTCGDIPDADECWGATGLVCYPNVDHALRRERRVTAGAVCERGGDPHCPVLKLAGVRRAPPIRR